MATIGERLAQPEEGWKRIDDMIGLIKYEGTWQKNMNNNSSWLGTRHISSNQPDKVVRMTFKGTKFRLLVNSASNRSTNSVISIDGEEFTFSSRFTTTLTIAPTRLAFEKLDLEDKYHTVIIRDNTTDYLDIDSIDIDEDGDFVRYDYLDSAIEDEEMKKYGVAWFGFDEDEGKVLDKLGNTYTGTITNATRVEGWNGEGKSLQFNGNGSVVFDEQVVPLNSKTIRFKIKPDNLDGIKRILDASLNSSRGVSIITSDGAVRFIIRANSAPNYVDSPVKLNVNEWNDVVISYSGKDEPNNVYIGVNGVFANYYLRGLDTLSYDVLYLGKTNPAFGTTATSEILRGRLDDVMIYSNFITSNEIKHKYTVIKTSDDKIITLPLKKGRVKELPSDEELDIINHGYIWNDADNASDAEGIKFTEVTTQYEVVGKSNIALGNGKMFTLPISNFETVSIENND